MNIKKKKKSLHAGSNWFTVQLDVKLKSGNIFS